MDAHQLREKLSDTLSRLNGVCLVYLFGSRSTGHVGPVSDYDLGVLVDRAADGDQICAEIVRQVARALRTDRVDVVLLNRAPVELAYATLHRKSPLRA